MDYRYRVVRKRLKQLADRGKPLSSDKLRRASTLPPISDAYVPCLCRAVSVSCCAPPTTHGRTCASLASLTEDQTSLRPGTHRLSTLVRVCLVGVTVSRCSKFRSLASQLGLPVEMVKLRFKRKRKQAQALLRKGAVALAKILPTE